MATIRVRVHKQIFGHKPGDEVEIPVFEDGAPTQLFWRRRLRDAERDGCVSIVQPAKASKRSAPMEDAPPVSAAAPSDRA